MKDYNAIPIGPALGLNESGEEVSLGSDTTSPIKLFIDELPENSLSFARSHWHTSIQLSIVIKGCIEVTVNDQAFILHKGDGIIINSNVLHHMNTYGKRDSATFSIQMASEVICGQNYISLHSKYVAPVVCNTRFPCIALHRSEVWQRRVLTCLHNAMRAEAKKEIGYELEIKTLLADIWLLLLRHLPGLTDKIAVEAGFDDKRIKMMLGFIHENYLEKITLADIAASASISQSECCRCFQRLLKATPFEYLMRYRIESAARLLATTDILIPVIAAKTGFSEVSYFYRVFKKMTRHTPKEYRERYQKI